MGHRDCVLTGPHRHACLTEPQDRIDRSNRIGQRYTHPNVQRLRGEAAHVGGCVCVYGLGIHLECTAWDVLKGVKTVHDAATEGITHPAAMHDQAACINNIDIFLYDFPTHTPSQTPPPPTPNTDSHRHTHTLSLSAGGGPGLPGPACLLPLTTHRNPTL